MFDAALDRIMSELDDVEGGSAMSHSVEDCPDPLGCTMHEAENAEPLAGDDKGKSIVEIKLGAPSMDGDKAEGDSAAEEGLSDEEAEELRKLLGK